MTFVPVWILSSFMELWGFQGYYYRWNMAICDYADQVFALETSRFHESIYKLYLNDNQRFQRQFGAIGNV